MRVLRSFILVQPMSKEQLGKVIMPESVQDEWLRGKVISLGAEVEGDIKEGDVVIYPPSMNGGSYPSVGSEGFVIIPEQLIWAVE